MTLTDTQMSDILTALTAAGGPFDPAALFLGVATGLVDNGGATVIGDVTPATGAMATRQGVTPWSASAKLTDGRWYKDGPLLTFSPASAAETQLLTHWFLADAAVAGNLLAFKPLVPTQQMPDETRDLKILMRLTVDPSGRWDAAVVMPQS